MVSRKLQSILEVQIGAIFKNASQIRVFFFFSSGSFYEKLHETAKLIVFSSLEKFLGSIAIR